MSRVKVSPEFEQKWSGGSALATECTMNCVMTYDLLIKRIEETQRPLGLSAATGLVITQLANSKKPMSPSELSENLILSRATITGLLDTLERRGYVTRKPHPTDRRMLLVEITDEGRKAARTMREQLYPQQKKWFEVLNPEEQKQFIQFMWRIQDSLEIAGKTE
jgi:DNA-binding MarR family transcriptional regulator